MTPLAEFRVPDALFPTDNDLEVPTLRLDMQAQCCEIPFVCYGQQRRTYRMEGSGTLHFYTDDYRYPDVYEKPEKILAHNPRNIVEPNYTITNETAVADGLSPIYRKRMLARTLQDKGIRIFVDLNVATKFASYNTLGIPQGWSAFSTRGYDGRENDLEFEYAIATRISCGTPLTFVVYGGGEAIKRWCMAHECVYVTPTVQIRNTRMALIKRAENVNTSLFANVPDFGPVVPTIQEMMKSQVSDFREPRFKEFQG